MDANEILAAVAAMSQEERRELAKLLKEPEPKAPVVTQNCVPIQIDERGFRLSDEAKWDAEHPLQLIAYGYEQHDLRGHGRRLTDAEVDAINGPKIDAWLREKRKLFPDAKPPKVPRKPMG